MYRYIFTLVKQHLNTALPIIKVVDWYMQQDSTPGSLKVLPALYIEFKPTTTRSLGNNVQEAVVEYDAILITDCVYDNHKRMFGDTVNDHYSVVEKVFAKLSGFTGMLSDLAGMEHLKDTELDYKICSGTDRTNIATDHRNKAIIKTTQTFKCYAKDYTATKKYQKVLKGLTIENFEISTRNV
jgi:hypothetical protein